ncbi:MAG: DUF4911 domain-containing protein [Nitrospinaceae bacterium]|nr:DUF4911 domain-containing protein [Nitrospinaceae bacterium]NIR53642.1 DUF4911 domain-containing protein [Nitrospinaceae bacterium]NIS84048.1 DUF4911 domain-containing protein [Nitrospinaceae bacterium]NIT80849.1 DUF4911 domain-containing protein [Nitrospinaceae bacterium]NIU43158.1 DUF4911 domain-containing protein [Nitrospinaceae bacterium]
MPTDSVQWILEVDKRDIAYIVGLFESYDDFAVVRTLDPARGHIELMVSPDFVTDTAQLVERLAEEIPLRILKP